MLKISIALAAVLAAPAFAQGAPAPVTFVSKAGASDLYEKTSSQLVLQSSKDAKVRKFATMMVADHTKSTNDVKMAAKADRVPVSPPKLDAIHEKMVADLRAASGANRDRLYVEQQKTAHQQALQLHSDFAASGSKPGLKRVAAATAPVVQHHIDMLGSM